jgi:acyl-CoA reductase-like NAD-dependent aldehyde dehydrogenase
LFVKTFGFALPPGVLQLAQGDGSVGAQLVGHPNIHLIAMTGSSATGRKILAHATPQMKRVVLEMGGKDPMVVFDDADVDKAAQDAVAYSLANTGQVCCSIERIYVAESVYDLFQELAKKYAAEYKVGNGMDPDVKVGPLVSQLQFRLVKEQVEDAIARGAKVLLTSPIPDLSNSTFYPVTVLSDVTHEMKVMTSETFGPVVAMTKFDGTEKEAIRLSNDTEYGLGSAVYTKDMERAKRVAEGIAAGQVGINCYAMDHMNVNCPWCVQHVLSLQIRFLTGWLLFVKAHGLGSFVLLLIRVGQKHSGFGFHSGVEGFHQFSMPKSLVYAPSP